MKLRGLTYDFSRRVSALHWVWTDPPMSEERAGGLFGPFGFIRKPDKTKTYHSRNINRVNGTT